MSEKTRTALALGSGGARGYAHIGVIGELEDQGFEIVGIAGTSMGALVGGLYAAGKLGEYTEWARSLTQREVIRLLDPTLRGPGVLRAEKVFAKVSELTGDLAIEDLAIPFTAVATDLTSRKEVWFQRGRLDSAIRASVAIPGLVTPVVMDGKLLVDGGIMNPVPVAATASMPADLTIAVSLTEEILSGGWHAPTREQPATEPGEDPSDTAAGRNRELGRVLTTWLESIRGRFADDVASTDAAAGTLETVPGNLRTRDVLDLAIDTLRNVVANFRLAGYPPDLLITIPRDACGTMDFHRADELIELGRERARAALATVRSRP
jgi:NTE family protein